MLARWKKARENILGHEVVGEVVGKGKDVTGIRDGDRVCIGDFNTCRSFNILPECENCSNGRGVICTQKHLRKFNAFLRRVL